MPSIPLNLHLLRARSIPAKTLKFYVEFLWDFSQLKEASTRPA